MGGHHQYQNNPGTGQNHASLDSDVERTLHEGQALGKNAETFGSQYRTQFRKFLGGGGV